MISVTEAHRRFGDLATIRNGVTTWIEVQTSEGTWRPVFSGVWFLLGYAFTPKGES
jgi:hypothetical protein